MPTPQKIIRVDLIKKDGNDNLMKLKKLEVRIGDVDTSKILNKALSENAACGLPLPEVPNRSPKTSHFCPAPGLNGRYMTIQVMVTSTLTLVEVDVLQLKPGSFNNLFLKLMMHA